MTTGKLNGYAKHVGIVVGCIAVLSAVFTAGVSYSALNTHTNDNAVHESVKIKEERIDERVRFQLTPIEVELKNLNDKMNRILAKVE